MPDTTSMVDRTEIVGRIARAWVEYQQAIERDNILFGATPERGEVRELAMRLAIAEVFGPK